MTYNHADYLWFDYHGSLADLATEPINHIVAYRFREYSKARKEAKNKR